MSMIKILDFSFYIDISFIIHFSVFFFFVYSFYNQMIIVQNYLLPFKIVKSIK